MGSFFDVADVVFKTATPTPSIAAQGVLVEAFIPSTELVPIGEGTYTQRVSETAPTPAEALTPQKGAISPVVVQIEVTSLATPLVISTSDPFTALSQAVKDGSSLVVTLSSIPSSATHGPDADLSFEGSEDVLEDPDDKPTMKKMASDFEEEESVEHEAEFMGMHLLIFLSSLLFYIYICSLYICICVTPFCCGLLLSCVSIPLIAETFKEPGVVVDTDMPTATFLATPVAPIFASVSVVPTVSVSVTLATPIPAISTAPTLTGPSVFLSPISFFTSSL